MNALLAFNFKCDPNDWDDEKWARMWAYLQYAIELESKNNKGNGRR